MRNYLGLILMLVVLAGCSTADVTGDITERDYTLRVTNSGSGDIYMEFPTSVQAATTTDTGIETSNSPTNETNPSLMLPNGGSIATIAGEAVDGISNTPDNSVEIKDSNNQTENSTSAPASNPVIIKPVDEKVKHEDPKKPIVDKKHNSQETHSLELDHEKMHAWLDLTGGKYGKDIRFVWPGCNDLLVPDASVTTTRDGSSNQKQAYYFCGTDPDHQHGMSGRASIYADPSCKATTVTLFYNTPEEQTKTTEYSSKETIEPWNYKGKSFGRFEHPGTFYGKNARLSTVRDCGEMIIKDASVSQGYYGTQNFNQNYYFSGSDYPDKDHEYFTDGRAAFMTRIGCIADTATIEYNE